MTFQMNQGSRRLDLSRRDLMRGFAGTIGYGLVAGGRPMPALATTPNRIIAQAGSAGLRGTAVAPTQIWGYNGQAPGPVLRVRQGEDLHVRLINQIAQPTSLHWHGIRIANAMDGVPGLTQQAVEPGQSFDYSFRCPDAGTFWYHPHKLAAEQMARGLHGVLVVEEKDPPRVDQDLVLVLDDWRLKSDGQIHAESFGSIGERAHGGRYGNTFTLNGSTDQRIPVRAGERLRLRLCNVSNANIFGFHLAAHALSVIAIDGQPVEPHKPVNDIVVLGPGQRADVIADMVHEPGTNSAMTLVTFDEQASIGALAYDQKARLRTNPLETSIRLAANPLDTRLDLENAAAVTLTMEGGAMSGMRGATVGGTWLDMRRLVNQHGYVWSFNGIAGMPDKPLFRVPRGRTVKVRIVNQTAWPHAMHLHGHHFKEVARYGEGQTEPFWRDTIVTSAREDVTMAFVADNPGKWMFHCHMLEHQEGGMATWFEVVA